MPKDMANGVFDRVEGLLNETIQKRGGLTLHVPFVIIDAVNA